MRMTGSENVEYVRFQSPHRNGRGHFTGVFGLVNTLAREGRLQEGQESFRRSNNRWYDAAYTDPYRSWSSPTRRIRQSPRRSGREA